MSDPFERVKAGRLTFKDGSVATRSKAIDKKKNKKKKKKQQLNPNDDGPNSTGPTDLDVVPEDAGAEAAAGGPETYTIDAAKRMKYDQLFPVEAKKFGYDPKSVAHKSIEDALDDRVKKKADRYCK
ncbi:uncharacterized protein Pyn_23644 [Prunus yedoensis var. nudiflora]|uniref:Uncharacterized protein n=3 Tax=Prunus TaxID=3754 RepID=A0A6J5XHA1_PRUAR|nr:uncharacterized protein LOC110746070 [Prunus avium]KAH0976120.1 hypothetical protein GBA52_018019 [Prunus armeniaca]PQM40407.1 uncharacterized protein Pyn_21477 [Prunus yedoensis var. nudiflora]PQQ02865.1 uncharacterized protein Pyn_23644 [Prunus yedoensis var. nudiflora]CAB4281602.1 unnamed protein product [Prunus armeniaca]CAB4311893.1 unnamed protein product [Prunus armeniaca]